MSMRACTSTRNMYLILRGTDGFHRCFTTLSNSCNVCLRIKYIYMRNRRDVVFITNLSELNNNPWIMSHHAGLRKHAARAIVTLVR